MASDDDGGASDGRITEYDQFREATAHKPLTPPAPQPQTWWLVPFILLTAAGGHASGHALMPAAPAMEKAGMSAIQYSLLTLVPIAGEVVMPVLWGRFFGRRPRSALCYAPLGLLSGQLAAAAALALRERAGGDFDARSIALVISGLSLYLLSKGGLTVMQHATMALALHAAADRTTSNHLERTPRSPGCTRAAPLTCRTFGCAGRARSWRASACRWARRTPSPQPPTSACRASSERTASSASLSLCSCRVRVAELGEGRANPSPSPGPHSIPSPTLTLTLTLTLILTLVL